MNNTQRNKIARLVHQISTIVAQEFGHQPDISIGVHNTPADKYTDLELSEEYAGGDSTTAGKKDVLNHELGGHLHELVYFAPRT